MPYNPSTGVYSLPAIYLAIPGTVIIAAQHNTPLQDLATANNYPRPVIAGGTGSDNLTSAATSLQVVSYGSAQVLTDPQSAQARANIKGAGLEVVNTFTKTQKWAKGADVASAAALTLGTDGNYFDITGTTTITSIATVGVGTWIKLHFNGILTLTHNATSLVLPNGGNNIVTAAGDEAEFVEYSTGNWRCVSYQKRTLAGITRATAISAASQTAMDFTSIPSGVRKITVSLVGLSTNGTDPMIIQIGTSGGLETTGYLGSASNVVTTVSSAIFTTGFGVHPSLIATNIINGAIQLVNASGNDWAAGGTTARSDTASTSLMGGSKTLAGTLDRVRITTTGGTNVFDAGSANIMWEF